MKMCPICEVYAMPQKHNFPGSPYWLCQSCDFLFQDPLPPKKFEADQEKGPDGRSAGHTMMTQRDKDITATLARAWFHNHLEPLGKKPTRTLDMGAKYPYFAHILKKNCECDAWAIDAMDHDDTSKDPIFLRYATELNVKGVLVDFEKADPDSQWFDGTQFDGISMIHVFEHIYNPVAGLQSIARLLSPKNSVLIRMPDHRIEGAENHLSPRHYQVHPYFYSERAFRKVLQKYEAIGPHVHVHETYPVGGGVRDYLLRFDLGI